MKYICSIHVLYAVGKAHFIRFYFETNLTLKSQETTYLGLLYLKRYKTQKATKLKLLQAQFVLHPLRTYCVLGSYILPDKI
jgi:hypothetical protein